MGEDRWTGISGGDVVAGGGWTEARVMIGFLSRCIAKWSGGGGNEVSDGWVD